MKLSVITIICDKDYSNIYNIINQFIEKINFQNKELIIMDNREKYLSVKLNIPKYIKHIVLGKNYYQLIARKKAISYITGNYVWFIDGDDEILKMDESFVSSGKDIYTFNFKNEDKEDISTDKCPGLPIDYNGDLFNETIYYRWHCPLWNKLFKSEIVKKIEPEIPNDNIVYNEDALIWLLLLKYSKSIQYINECIYLQHINVTVCNLNKKTKAEDIKHLLIGYEQSRKITKELCTDKLPFETMELNNIIFFFSMNYINIEEKKKSIQIIKEYYPFESIKKAWNENFSSICKNKKEYEELYNLLCEIMECDMRPTVIMTRTYADGRVITAEEPLEFEYLE